MHTQGHAHRHMHTYAYTHMRVHVRIYACVCAHTCTDTHTSFHSPFITTPQTNDTFICMHTHAHTHTHMYAHTHTHMHVHLHRLRHISGKIITITTMGPFLELEYSWFWSTSCLGALYVNMYVCGGGDSPSIKHMYRGGSRISERGGT